MSYLASKLSISNQLISTFSNEPTFPKLCFLKVFTIKSHIVVPSSQLTVVKPQQSQTGVTI